jgi:hypothetical protein
MGVALMPLRIRATSPVYCGKCGKRRGPLHTCIVRKPAGRTKVKAPKLTLFDCPRCGKPYANPLTHVCPSRRGDFKRRKAAAARRERKRKAEELRRRHKAERARRRAQGGTRPSGKHRYDRCPDKDCPRLPCRAYREGVERGLEEAEELARDLAEDMAEQMAKGSK